MANVIIPKHTAELVYFNSAMKILSEDKNWIPMGAFTDRLFAHLKAIGKEQSRHSDNTHYTKCSQLPCYFGFAERSVVSGKTYLRITALGEKFYSAILARDDGTVLSLLVDSIENGSFGENNDGVPSSRSDVDAPNLFIRASYELDGLSNKEFAFLLWSLVDKNEDYTGSVGQLRNYRAAKNWNLPNGAAIYQDCKPIMILNRWGFLSTGSNGLVVAPSVDALYHDRLLNLKIYSVDRNVCPTSSKKSPSKENVQLSTALLVFARYRSDSSWAAGYYETNRGTREYYAKLSAGIGALDVAKVEEMFLGVKDAKGNVVFQPMWSGSNGTGWGHVKKGLDEDPQATIDAIRKYHDDASVVSVFAQKGFARPSGFGDSVVSELLMKFHPDAAIKCGKKTIGVLKKLNLMTFKHDGSYDGWEYRQALGIATDIKFRMDEMGITRTLEDHEEADYITVNEFVAWCHDNFDLIMQEWSKHMKHEIKLTNQTAVAENDFAAFIKKFIDAAKDAGLTYDDNLIKRFVCALMAKPFVVLTGLSGSGKTKLADAFTQWIGTDDMVKVVPVGADWTNNEKMLGYPNALDGTKYVLSDTGILKFLLDARDNPTVPFFLVLDEMNLSHVERYFADFLSAMESGKKIHLYDGNARMSNDGIPIPAELEIPKNLFVIGTMNVDETTYMFSPKVLDRAQVVEFRVSPDEMKAFLAAPTYPKMDALKGKGLKFAEAFLELSQKRGEKKVDDKDASKELQDVLNAIFPELAKLGSEFAYRCAIEVVSFVAYYLDACGYYGETDKDKKKTCCIAAIDAAMLQKLLPKLHGSLNRLGPAIDVMLEKFSSEEKPDANGEGDEKKVPIYPLSHDKLLRMKDRLEANGFTSYAEA